MNEPKRTLLEFGIVLVGGLAFALTANALNSRGLKLTRNYFPAHPVAKFTTTQPVANLTTQATTDTTMTLSHSPIAQKLQALGIGMVTADEVQAMLDDPGYESGIYLLVDARNDQHYTEGHIPGAYQLDHYEIERYIEKVLPPAMSASKVVVYCGGGETCEDSELVARDLVFAYGVDASRVFVYMGGMKEWNKLGRLVEKGERGSGNITEGKE